VIEKTSDLREREMTSMQRGRNNTERLRELAARIAAEQDHDKFTALVQEFNELVDEKQAPQESPKDRD
jgi:hypothetical protein